MDFEWLKRRRVEGRTVELTGEAIEVAMRDRAWARSEVGRAWLEAPWVVRKMVRGRRVKWCTQTAHRGTAQQRADAHFQHIIAEQWHLVDRAKQRAEVLTIGRLVELYKAWPQGKEQSRRTNALQLLGIVRAVLGDPEDQPLAALDGRLVREWQIRRMRAAAAAHPDSHSEEHQAMLRGANDALRQAKCVFARAVTQYYADLGITLPPSVAEVCAVAPIRARPPAAFGGIPEAVMLRVIDEEAALETADPGVWCTLWLMLGAGLRNSEIIRARWSDLREDPVRRCWVMSVAGKSAAVRQVVLAPDIIERLRRVRQPGQEHLVPARTKTDRDEAAHRRINTWLREVCGLEAEGGKVSYQLRKAYANAVEQAFGLRAAQTALGHEDSKTTLRHYLSRQTIPAPVSVV